MAVCKTMPIAIGPLDPRLDCCSHRSLVAPAPASVEANYRLHWPAYGNAAARVAKPRTN